MKTQAIGILILLLLGGMGKLYAQSSDKPHVLFIFLDDLNDYPAHLGGHPQAQTPHMNGLAGRGYSFNNAYSNSPICGPSRASMLTGKDTEYTGIYSNGGGYSLYPRFRDIFSNATGNPTVFTLPGYMKDVGGYYVAGFNKIFHGPYPLGFDNDYDSVELDPCAKSLSWNQYEDFRTAPDVSPVDKDGFTSMQFGKLPDAEEPNMQDSRTVSAAINFLNEYASNPGDYCDRPMFLAVGLYRPHNPYFAPERFFTDLYRNDFDAFPYEVPYNEPNNLFPPNGLVRPSKVTSPGEDFDDIPPLGKLFGLSKDSSWLNFDRYADFIDPLPAIGPGLDVTARKAIINESARALAEMSYLTALRFADEQVGKLLFALDQHPEIRDNTIIVMLSDHGYSWGTHRHHHKSGMWETDSRVPFVIYDPRRTGRRELNSIVTLLDVFPTLLELTGTEQPLMPDGSQYLDGRTLVPVMDNPGKFLDQPALMAYQGPPILSDGNCFPQYSLRSKDFRYIRYRTNGDAAGGCNLDSSEIQEELYEIGFNRNVDPKEWNNLASDPAYDIVKTHLSQWLPDGQLYLKQVPHILYTGIPNSCSLTNDDTLNISLEIRNQDGSLVDTTGAGITIQWNIRPGGFTIDGPRATIPIADIPELDASGEFIIQCRANLPDGAFLFERQRFYVTDQINAEDFALLKNGRTVETELTGPTSPGFQSYWEFGNGIRLQTEIPPAHAYTNPGIYEITRELVNVYNGCSYRASKLVSIETTDFDSSICLAPGWKEMTAASSEQAQVSWNPTFNADAYIYRYRRSGFFQNALWAYGTRTSTETQLNGLKPDTEYEFQMASVCGTDTSEWDFPIAITTEECSPPYAFQNIAIDSTSAQLSWRTGTGAITDQGFRLRQMFGPPAFTFLPAGATGNTFTGLDEATQFQLTAVSFCQQLIGPNRFGPLSDFYYFETPATATREQLPVQQLKLFPNPSNGQVKVSGFTVENELIRFTIFDERGKVVFYGKHTPKYANDILEVDLDGLPSGYYIMELSGEHTRWSGGFSLKR